MVKIVRDRLVFHFPNVHEHAKTAIELRRSLRVPDDGRTYPAPPSLKPFPLRRLSQGGSGRGRSEIAIPLYQADAMWLLFSGGKLRGYPCAIKIGTGGINSISGKPWKPDLDAAEEDYLVVPRQARLDGYCTATDRVRQFVAMPLGSDYPVAQQLIGGADHGDLQIVVYPLLGEHYEHTLRHGYENFVGFVNYLSFGAISFVFPPAPYFRRPRQRKMSLAAGGRLRQPIFKDPHGIDAWDQSAGLRCTVTLANAHEWPELTGEKMPTEPPTPEDYRRASLPWLDHYADDGRTRGGSPELAKVKSVQEVAEEKDDLATEPDWKVEPDLIEKRGPNDPSRS
jgi:hypothetical protein